MEKENKQYQEEKLQESFTSDGINKEFETSINAVSSSQLNIEVKNIADEIIYIDDPIITSIKNGWRISFNKTIQEGAIINIIRKTPLKRTIQFNEASYFQLNELNDEFSILLHMIQEMYSYIKNQNK